MRSSEGFFTAFLLADWRSFEDAARFHKEKLRVKDLDEFLVILVGKKRPTLTYNLWYESESSILDPEKVFSFFSIPK